MEVDLLIIEESYPISGLFNNNEEKYKEI